MKIAFHRNPSSLTWFTARAPQPVFLLLPLTFSLSILNKPACDQGSLQLKITNGFLAQKKLRS